MSEIGEAKKKADGKNFLVANGGSAVVVHPALSFLFGNVTCCCFPRIVLFFLPLNGLADPSTGALEKILVGPLLGGQS